jgi:putative SOS response-associated peptidase YedK
MCGRYRRTTAEEELARRYHIPIPAQRDLPISWNIAPTQDVLAIRFNPATKQRSLDVLRWGLIPNWATDPKIAYKTINARVETVDTAPSYRQAFKKRRCLIPVDGFYEWKKALGGKIPYSISMKDEVPIILISGYDPTSVASRAKKFHIFDFLQKPFSREMICNAMKKAIGSTEGV